MPSGWTMVLVLSCPLASCAPPDTSADPSEPVTIDDLQPLPAEVNRGNARLVVRSGLQAHRRANALPDEQYGYVFKEAGFVQLLHQTPPDRAQERAVRIFVDYASITSVTGEPYFDLQFLRERFRIAVKGSFRRWEAPVHGSRGLPALGCEPWAIPIESLSLSLDDPVTAKRLMDALWLLSGR